MNPSALSHNKTLAFLFYHHPLPMWIYDRETLAYLDVNDAAIDKYGYSRDEFLSLTLTAIRPAEEVARLLEDVVQERPPLQHSGMWRHRLKNGELIDVEITSHTIEYAGRAAALVVAQDITERKRAEEALRASEEHFRALIQHNQDVITLTSATGQILFESPSLTRILGFSPAERIGHNAITFIHPDDRARASHYFATLLEVPDKPIQLEVRCQHQDGSYRWLELIGSNLLDEPNVQAIVANYRDITERKQTEASLLETKESLENAEEQAKLGSWELMVGSERGRWSKQMFRLFDLEPADSAPDFATYLDLIHPEDQPILLKVLNQLMTGDEPTIQIFRSNPARLPLRYFSPTWHSLRDAQGQPIKFTGTLQDITAQVLAEGRIRYQANLIEKVSDAIVATDGNFVVRSWNHAAANLYGWTAAEAIGQVFNTLVTTEYLPGDRERALEQLRTNDFWQGEVIQYHQNGTALHILSSVSLIRDATGQPTEAIAVNRDISERKKLEKEKAELATQLLQAQKNEAIGRLAGGIAHDFNNMLVPIIGFADLEMMDVPEDSRHYERLAQIKKAALRAANLTRQILAFSRQQVLELRTVDLNRVIVDFQEILHRLLGENIQIRLHLVDPLPSIQADPGQLEQVVMNLAINARDAMPDGGFLTIETASVMLDETYTARHVGSKPGPHVLLAVSDTGVGMDAAAQQRIFEPFFTTKPQGKGTGLGLATVFGVVKQHEGNIWVYSEPGQGTTFKIYLPASAQADRVSTPDPAPIGSLNGTETVLVVEDEGSVRQLITETLEAHGYQVLVTDDPREGIKIAQTYPDPIHLLLTDVIMPHHNGRDLYELLVKSRPDLKVLYMSGYTNNVIVRHGVLYEGVVFLPKPFTIHSLLEKVRLSLRQDGSA